LQTKRGLLLIIVAIILYVNVFVIDSGNWSCARQYYPGRGLLQDLVQPAFTSLSSEFFFFSAVLQLEIDLTLMHCESRPFLEM